MIRFIASFVLLWLAINSGLAQAPIRLLQDDSFSVLTPDSLQRLVKHLRFGGGPASDYLLAAENIVRNNSISNRKLASGLLSKAILQYPENAELKLARASLLKYQGFKTQSIETFESALSIDSTLAWGWYQLGELYQKKMDKFKDEVSSVSSAMDFERFALKYYDLAQKCYTHCVDLNFGADSLKIKMFWLYYEAGQYERALTSIEGSDDDWRLNALGGLGYYALKEYAPSSAYFESARRKWPQAEHDEYLASLKLVYPKINGLSDQVFAAKDPLLITLYNERELAHLARFTYAQQRFSLPEFGIKGASSDRGKVLIKYGFPERILKYRAEIENNKTLPPTIIWYYPKFNFVFSDEHQNGNYRFAEPDLLGTFGSRSRVNSSYSLNAENLFDSLDELYQLRTAGGRIEPPLEVLDKRDVGEIEFLWALPDSMHSRIFKGWQFQFFEREGANVTGKAFHNKLKIWHRDSLYHFSAGLPFAFRNEQNSVSGIFEGYNKLNGQFFTLPVHKKLRRAADSLIFISDTELAYYSFDMSGEPRIVPTSIHKFSKRDQPYISFSLDNLAFSKTGENALLAEFNLKAIPPETSLWQDVISVFSGEIKLPETVAISSEYRARGKKDDIHFILDTNNLASGKYQLTVSVIEKLSGRVVEKETVIEIL